MDTGAECLLSIGVDNLNVGRRFRVGTRGSGMLPVVLDHELWVAPVEEGSSTGVDRSVAGTEQRHDRPVTSDGQNAVHLPRVFQRRNTGKTDETVWCLRLEVFPGKCLPEHFR